MFASAEAGTASTIFAATDSAVREKPNEFGGAYIVPPGKIGKATPQSQDPELGKEVKAFSDEQIKKWGIHLDV